MVADTAEWVACEQTSGLTYFSACLHPGSWVVRMLNNLPVANPGRRRGTARRLGAVTPGPPITDGAFSHLLRPFGLRVTREGTVTKMNRRVSAAADESAERLQSGAKVPVS